ncbi:MAG: TIGR02266 family protein [Deltaproteobacteria bacterium]|nr:TIGR02266 family protein [Deltaproteobacteria bacterium]
MTIPPENRRRFVRVPLTVMVQYRATSVDALLDAHTVDVSEGGLFLRTDRPRPMGTRVQFRILLEDGGTLLEGTAVVVRCLPVATEGSAAGMALTFTQMEEPSRAALRDLVARAAARRG